MAGVNKKSGTSSDGRKKSPTYENFPDKFDDACDSGYERVFSQLPLTDVTSLLEDIERSQAKMSADVRNVQLMLASLHELIESLRKTVLDTALQQEKLGLTTQDCVQESADHLEAQLMDIRKNVEVVKSDQRKLISATMNTYATLPSIKPDLDKSNTKAHKAKAKGLPNL